VKVLLNLTPRQNQSKSSPAEEHRNGTGDAGRRTWTTSEKMVQEEALNIFGEGMRSSKELHIIR